jgi:hypothetical protein
VVILPDGTKVTAASFGARGPYARDRQPDYGLYLDRRWQPPWVVSVATGALERGWPASPSWPAIPLPARSPGSATSTAPNPSKPANRKHSSEDFTPDKLTRPEVTLWADSWIGLRKRADRGITPGWPLRRPPG